MYHNNMIHFVVLLPDVPPSELNECCPVLLIGLRMHSLGGYWLTARTRVIQYQESVQAGRAAGRRLARTSNN
jgi:hypothetical protein